MLYRRTNLMNNQAELLREFEARLDSLLEKHISPHGNAVEANIL